MRDPLEIVLYRDQLDGPQYDAICAWLDRGRDDPRFSRWSSIIIRFHSEESLVSFKMRFM